MSQADPPPARAAQLEPAAASSLSATAAGPTAASPTPTAAGCARSATSWPAAGGRSADADLPPRPVEAPSLCAGDSMAEQDSGLIGPVTAKQRIQELDVLRGIALFGVLVMNFVAFAGDRVMMTEAQMAALPTATARLVRRMGRSVAGRRQGQHRVRDAVRPRLLPADEARRGQPGFEARYRRRLFWLLVFGWLNTLFLWVVGHPPPLCGRRLLPARDAPLAHRALVDFGAVAALYSDKVAGAGCIEHARPADRQAPSTSIDEARSSPGRQLARRRRLPGDRRILIVAVHVWRTGWSAALLVALIVYAIGRFALGAAIGRSGILDDIPRFVPLLRRIAWIAIPLGLVLGAADAARSSGDIGAARRSRADGRPLRTSCAPRLRCSSPPAIARRSSLRCKIAGESACSACSPQLAKWR